MIHLADVADKVGMGALNVGVNVETNDEVQDLNEWLRQLVAS